MITLNTATHIKPIRESGSIISNNKVYHSPTANDKNWDICFKFNYPYNVLCNFTATQFKHQGVKIQSMEGFLQSLKVKDKKTQEKICTLSGFMAKKVGNYLKHSGNFDRVTVYWQGKQYDRNSEEFKQVISEAYDSKYAQDRIFRTVLKNSKGRKLTHTIGKNDPVETILTEDEFIEHLDNLRSKKLPLKSRGQNFIQGVKDILFPQKTTKAISEKLPEYKTAFVNDIYMCGENPLENAGKIKRLGVKNIIDVNATTEEAKERSAIAKKHNLKYLNITFDDHKKIENAPETIKEITDLYNEGAPTYIISKQKHDANVVFGVNYLYNPQATLADGVMYGTPQKQFISKLTSLKHQLRAQDKSALGWNSSYEETFSQRRKTILELNG